MTLIEMVMAIAVVAVLLLPMAGVFYTGQRTDAQNRRMGDAVALGDAALAKADAVTYPSLGFYENQFAPFNCTGTVPNYNGQTGVNLGCQPPAGVSPAVLPVDTSLRVGSVQYTLTTYVVWATGAGSCAASTAPGSACVNAYKQVYAVVTWKAGNTTMSTTETALVYPGGLGPYTTGGGLETPSGSPSAPPNVTGLSIQAAATTSSSLTLQWTDPGSPEPGWYEIVEPNGSNQPAVNTSGTDSSWDPTGAAVVGTAPPTASGGITVSGLQPSTSYTFVLVAFSSDGSQWAVSQTSATGTTSAATPPPSCTLSSLVVQQNGQSGLDALVVKKNAGNLMNNVNITVGYTGTCSGSSGAVVVSATGAANLGPYTLTYQSSPGQFSYNPPTGLCTGTYATGTYTFTVTLGGVSQSTTANVGITSTTGSAKC
jgi:hypothetical protein